MAKIKRKTIERMRKDGRLMKRFNGNKSGMITMPNINIKLSTTKFPE